MIIGGLTALISGACYAELCVEFPVSGGSFSYVMVSYKPRPAGVPGMGR